LTRIAALEELLSVQKKNLRTDVKNVAEAEKALADLQALEKEFLKTGNVKENVLKKLEAKIQELEAMEAAHKKSELHRKRQEKWEKFLEKEMSARTEIAQIFKNRMAEAVLDERMTDYTDIDDNNLTKLFKFIFRDLLWETILGAGNKSKDIPQQGNLLDQLTIGLIRTDADEVTFQKLKQAFVEDLKDNAKFDDVTASNVENLLQA